MKTSAYNLLACVLLYNFIGLEAVKNRMSKLLHMPKEFHGDDIARIASMYNETYFKEVLNHILVPRVVGTKSHEDVKNYISEALRSSGFTVEIDQFYDKTPNLGTKKFSNIIGTHNPQASEYLMLACHYDSKYIPNQVFLGATDSAVPCAMLLHLAKAISLSEPDFKHSKLSLMLVFFDGEEAFQEWNEFDSLYGARNLARKWELHVLDDKDHSYLDKVKLLVLLDLLGTKDPKFYSYFADTLRWHSFLSNTEKYMKSQGLIPSNQPLHFLEKSTFSFIEDDHLPFLKRGVPVLHVIPHPFPSVWHKISDNYSALDFPTISTLNKLIQVFTYAFLNGQ